MHYLTGGIAAFIGFLIFPDIKAWAAGASPSDTQSLKFIAMAFIAMGYFLLSLLEYVHELCLRILRRRIEQAFSGKNRQWFDRFRHRTKSIARVVRQLTPLGYFVLAAGYMLELGTLSA